MKEKIRAIAIIILSISVFSLSVISMQEANQEILVSAKAISNEKIGWGIKRNNEHVQPDLGSSRLETLSKNKGIAIGNANSKKI